MSRTLGQMAEERQARLAERYRYERGESTTDTDTAPVCQEERFIQVVISSRNESGVTRQFAPGQWVVVTDSAVFTTSSEKAKQNLQSVRNSQGQALLATDAQVAKAEGKISKFFGG